MHDKAKNDQTTIGGGDIIIGGEKLTPEQLKERGINTKIENAEVVTSDEEIKPTKFSWTEFNSEKAEELSSKGTIVDRAINGLQPLVEATEKLSNFFRESKNTNHDEFITKLHDLKTKMPEDEKHYADEALKQYNIGIENGLSPEASRYVVESWNDDLYNINKSQDQEVVKNKQGEVITTFVVTGGEHREWSEAERLVQEFYGDAKVPDNVMSKIYDAYLPYVEDGELKFTYHDDVAKNLKNKHGNLSYYGDKSDKMLDITKNLSDKYGVASVLGLTTVNLMTGGTFGKIAIEATKSMVGEKLFGEYVDKTKNIMVEKGTESLVEYDPYLSKKTASSFFKLGVELSAIGLGVSTDNLHMNKLGQRPAMGAYSKTKGHHVHAKAAFKDHFDYNPKEGFAISKEFMNSKSPQWKHEDMTSMQRKLFKELKDSGRANTMQEHTRIAVEALQAGGASLKEARSIVAQSLNKLRNDGVRVPSNIPWFNNNIEGQ